MLFVSISIDCIWSVVSAKRCEDEQDRNPGHTELKTAREWQKKKKKSKRQLLYTITEKRTLFFFSALLRCFPVWSVWSLYHHLHILSSRKLSLMIQAGPCPSLCSNGICVVLNLPVSISLWIWTFGGQGYTTPRALFLQNHHWSEWQFLRPPALPYPEEA